MLKLVAVRGGSPRCRTSWGGGWWWALWKPQSSCCWRYAPAACLSGGGCWRSAHWCSESGLGDGGAQNREAWCKCSSSMAKLNRDLEPPRCCRLSPHEPTHMCFNSINTGIQIKEKFTQWEPTRTGYAIITSEEEKEHLSWLQMHDERWDLLPSNTESAAKSAAKSPKGP